MNNSTELSREEKIKLVQEYAEQAKADKKVFINRFLWTFNPEESPYHFPFKLFPFQDNLVDELADAIDNGYDLFIDKSRKVGATYTTLAVMLWYWRYVPGSNFLLGSRKEAYVDNTKGDSSELSNKEESLFGKLQYMLNKLAPIVLPNGFKIDKHLTYMSLVNPENGNAVSGESSNPNFSRGGRHKAILLDEFAFWDNDTAAWGATADTTRCRIVLTTPGIKPSKAKKLRFGKDNEKIRVVEIDYSQDPRKTEQWLAGERERRSEEDMAREIMRNWETSIKGKVYPEIQSAILGDFPYQPNWSLYSSWDFGLDGVAFGFYQFNPVNGKMRLVDCYENSNQPIQFYFPFHGLPIDSKFSYTNDDLMAIQSVKHFKKPVHFGDPDVNKRSIVSETMESTRSVLAYQGIHIQTNPASNDFATRREKTKVMLQNGIEVNKTPRTEYWLECINNARYPQRPENTQATSEIALPIHDWTSHHRTQTEYLCVNYQPSQSNWIEENERLFGENYQNVNKDLKTKWRI